MARFWCKVGGAVGDIGEVRFGFTAPDDAYDGIADQLGITKLGENDSARGISFGTNYPKPPRVRITYRAANVGGGTANDVTRSVTRFCDPDKLGQVLNGGLENNRITVSGRQYPIVQASTIGR
ncbi:MAG: hypothetical protein AAFX78_16265 [Cyanobacteria bacterium J06638_20]